MQKKKENTKKIQKPSDPFRLMTEAPIEAVQPSNSVQKKETPFPRDHKALSYPASLQLGEEILRVARNAQHDSDDGQRSQSLPPRHLALLLRVLESSPKSSDRAEEPQMHKQSTARSSPSLLLFLSCDGTCPGDTFSRAADVHSYGQWPGRTGPAATGLASLWPASRLSRCRGEGWDPTALRALLYFRQIWATPM